ncbi:MAG: SGNH/GDSL hydrolase family protein [Clostridia bacterium]|nr:SGNH/GDSL hydrolase family protein [Clostridia bacterium]
MELRGKIIDFLGDSITEGYGVADRENNRYDNILKRECGLKAVYNYGIGGTRLAHQSVPSDKPRHDLCFCGRAYNLNPEADIIVVYGGVNDYLHGDAPIGKKGDKTPATFCGAVWWLMNFLKTKYVGKTIVFMTPARYCGQGSKSDTMPHPHASKLPDAKPLLFYVVTIKQTAEEFGIPVLDLYHNLGIDPHKPKDYHNLTMDGLHFNDDGHKIIAARLKEFLEAL